MTWTAYIQTDLTVRIASGQTPQPLTLHGLASHYRVSLTPVRQAVEQLIAQGVLRRSGGKKLQVDVKAARKLSAGLTPQPPVDPYLTIRDALMRQSLRGESVVLREVETAKRFDVSGTGLRQVFNRLTGEGLVQHIPRQGWRLRAFRLQEMMAFIQVRESMELLSLDLARPKLVVAELQELYDAQRLGEPPQADNRLHRYLRDKAENPYIHDFFERHGTYYDMLASWEAQDRQASIEAARQHRAILKALINKQWDLAKKHLSRHIRENYPVLRKHKLLPGGKSADGLDQD